MEKYIDLNRSFAPISRDHDLSEEDAFTFESLGLFEKQKWYHLLQLRRVVILAEAGAGKTKEIRETTERLRKEGKNAFCFSLEYLGSDFQNSFIRGTEAEFTSWLSSEEEGWFFLDSVDEAKLIAPGNFNHAIRSIGTRLGESLQRTHIFITSRVTEWYPQSDFALIKERLSYKKPEETREEETEGPYGHYGEGSSDEVRFTQKEPEPLAEPSIFSLLPLDKEQIRTYSKAHNVKQIDAFLDAIEKAEAEIFAKRPLDLDDLILYWKDNGRIANLAKLMGSSIYLKLKERDPDHDFVFPLTHDNLRWGAEMMASAVTFEKKNRILVPEPAPDPAIRRGSIDPSTVLKGYNGKEIRALLQRPIFDRAIYGTVRFHHRSVREFLTAKWLQRLLVQGKRRAVESLFFKTLYGQTVLAPSIRPILAWLALFDDGIRDKTSGIAPEIFIQGGDPSSLPFEFRKILLKQFCEAYADQKHMDLSFDLSEVRRFSHPDLDETVRGLLDTYSKHEEIRQLLLRIVWQGELKVCTEKALAFALDNSVNVYTRMCGIRAVAAAGSGEQQDLLIRKLLCDPGFRNERIIGELIVTFVPDRVAISDVLSFIQRLNRSEEHVSWIDVPLKEVCLKKCPDDGIIVWIRGFLSLIKQPPVTERGYFEVSHKHGWLLPISCLLAERLVRIRHPDTLDRHVLEIISMSQAERRYVYLYWEKHSLAELVPKWLDLNRALFWFDVNSLRERREKRNGNRLTHWRQIELLNRFWDFTPHDYERVIDDIHLKTHMDDRLMALSLAFHLYVEGGRGPKRLKKLKTAVHKIDELEQALHHFLHPPKMSKEESRWRRERSETRRKQEDNEKARAEKRRKWIEWLQENSKVLRDTSVAAEGNIWNATRYLLDELGEKRQNNSKWARSNWEALIPEFGKDVAEAYRDGCIAYWRNYRPKIRSEGISNPQSTPLAVVVGLSGLKMEARQGPQWPRNLSEQEAELACRYAMHEMNGFPSWLKNLHQVYSHIVEKLILDEIEWEFSRYDGEKRCHYVLDDLYWQLDWMKPIISDRLVSFLDRYEPKHDNTVQTALKIFLSCPDFNKKAFIHVAKIKVKTSTVRTRQILWLTTWMYIEAEGALKALRVVLGEFKDSSKATEFSMMFVTSLFGEWWERKNIENQDYLRPEILRPLIKLMYAHIPNDEDMDGTGADLHELKEKARESLSRLFEQLINIPGKATYMALMDLAEHHPHEVMRKHCLVHAKRRVEADAEMEPWHSGDVTRFTEDAEKVPRNHRELYELAVSRLLELKADLEDGGTSNAQLLTLAKEERLHRIYISDWLRNRSNGKYSLAPEEELADRKKPDIRLHESGFDGPVPIELKIAENCTGPYLFERLQNQLCGQYLRDAHSNRGIFLIVYRGEKGHWEDPGSGKMVCFRTLIQLLREEAKKIVVTDNKIEGLEIIAIDLTRRLSKRQSGST